MKCWQVSILLNKLDMIETCLVHQGDADPNPPIAIPKFYTKK